MKTSHTLIISMVLLLAVHAQANPETAMPSAPTALATLYSTSAKLQYLASKSDKLDAELTQFLEDLKQAKIPQAVVIQLSEKQPEVYKVLAQDQSEATVVELLTRQVTLKRLAPSDLIEVRFTFDDPTPMQQILKTYCDQVINSTVRRHIDAVMKSVEGDKAMAQEAKKRVEAIRTELVVLRTESSTHDKPNLDECQKALNAELEAANKGYLEKVKKLEDKIQRIALVSPQLRIVENPTNPIPLP